MGVTVPSFQATTYALDVAGLSTHNHGNQECGEDVFSGHVWLSWAFWYSDRNRERKSCPDIDRALKSCWKICAVPESCKLVVSQLLALWSTFCEHSIKLATKLMPTETRVQYFVVSLHKNFIPVSITLLALFWLKKQTNYLDTGP